MASGGLHSTSLARRIVRRDSSNNFRERCSLWSSCPAILARRRMIAFAAAFAASLTAPIWTSVGRCGVGKCVETPRALHLSKRAGWTARPAAVPVHELYVAAGRLANFQATLKDAMKCQGNVRTETKALNPSVRHDSANSRTSHHPAIRC